MERERKTVRGTDRGGNVQGGECPTPKQMIVYVCTLVSQSCSVPQFLKKAINSVTVVLRTISSQLL